MENIGNKLDGGAAYSRSIVICIDSRDNPEKSDSISDQDFEKTGFIHCPTYDSKADPHCMSDKRSLIIRRNDRADFDVLRRSKPLPEKSSSVESDKKVEINVRRREEEAPIYIADFLTGILKEHQIQGIRFLWRNIVDEASGAVLAHSMGLGKTLQTISFLYTIYSVTESPSTAAMPQRLLHSKAKPLRTLILCPPIVVENWESELYKWVPNVLLIRSITHVYKLKSAADFECKIRTLRNWNQTGGILLSSYQMYRDLVQAEGHEKAGVVAGSTQIDAWLLHEINKRREERIRQTLQARSYLCDPGPDLVVCDEAHLIKNNKTSLSKAVNQISTSHRICLTGYPLQNNLKEYWCMINFCRPGFLPGWDSFRLRFVRWIVDGLYRDATDMDRAYAKQKLYVLTVWLEPIVFRLDSQVLHQTLPLKKEYQIQCRLSPLQRTLYERFLSLSGGVSVKRLLAGTSVLTRIVNHPGTLKIARECLRGFGVGCVDEDEVESNGKSEDGDLCRSFGWVQPEIDQPSFMGLDNSGKIMIALRIIELARRNGEKTLLFSRSISTLDYLSAILEIYGIEFFRIDGTVQSSKRQKMIECFQPDTAADVFLLSSHTGSLGVNLTTASRVIIFDVGWNPCHDEQAIGRAFRYGQTRMVHVYRLCSFGTMESRLYNLNVFKVSLSIQAVDKKDIERLVTKDDLQEYFKAPSDPPPAAECGIAVSEDEDQLLRDLVRTHASCMVRIIDHQKILDDSSLLNLSQSEKVEALKELEIVKKQQEYLKAGLPVPKELETPCPHSYSTASVTVPSAAPAIVPVAAPRVPALTNAFGLRTWPTYYGTLRLGHGSNNDRDQDDDDDGHGAGDDNEEGTVYDAVLRTEPIRHALEIYRSRIVRQEGAQVMGTGQNQDDPIMFKDEE